MEGSGSSCRPYRYYEGRQLLALGTAEALKAKGGNGKNSRTLFVAIVKGSKNYEIACIFGERQRNTA